MIPSSRPVEDATSNTSLSDKTIDGPLRTRRLPILLVIFLGGIVSFGLFSLTRDWENSRIEANFKQAAGSGVSYIKKQMELNLHDIEALRAFFEASIDVDRQEFSVFVQPLLKRNPSIQALEWVPCVVDAQRADLENKARRDGCSNFHIKEWKSQEEMVPALQRAEYFPVYYVEPNESNERALGVDLGSNPARPQSALRRARDGPYVGYIPHYACPGTIRISCF